jgi:putative transposase
VVAATMGLLGWLRQHLEAADTDLLREMVLGVAQALMSAEADAACGAPLGGAQPPQINQRNGYRERRLDTRVGTLELAIPKLRAGSYHPGWLLGPRRRGERALVAVVAQCSVRGVSTRRVEGIVQTPGIASLSKSQVSELTKTLDEQVAVFRSRPLDAGPCLSVWWTRWRSSAAGRGGSSTSPVWWPPGSTPRVSGDPRGGRAHQRGRCRVDGVPA